MDKETLEELHEILDWTQDRISDYEGTYNTMWHKINRVRSKIKEYEKKA